MYKTFIRPLLDRLDSERWHDIAREALHYSERYPGLIEYFSYGGKRIFDERLNINLAEVPFENPLIVGAGWDKYGRSVKGLYLLGFSGVEVGSVTEHGQTGNPKPRQFMLNSGVCLNWLGFNSPGMKKVGDNLKKYRHEDIPIGISIGINKFVNPEDAPRAHATVADYLYPYASYFVINVSSPNTPKLRRLQEKDKLTEIVREVRIAIEDHGRAKPLFVKIDPDLMFEAIDDVIDVVISNGLAGIIATNTTVNTQIKSKYGEKWTDKPGGLSGDDDDYRKLSTMAISHIYKQAGNELEIIGVGGINNTESALEKIRAGAKALQIVTGIRGEGPAVAGQINNGLIEFMDREGIKNISEIVGTG